MATGRPHICGYCITGHHHQCRGVTVFEEKRWVCSCPHDVEGVAV